MMLADKEPENDDTNTSSNPLSGLFPPAKIPIETTPALYNALHPGEETHRNQRTSGPRQIPGLELMIHFLVRKETNQRR